MGIPVLFAADDESLLSNSLGAFAVWMGAPAVEGARPLHLWLETGNDAGLADREPEVRIDAARLRLTGGGIEGEADADRREARCIVPPGLIADPHRLAVEVLDTLLLFLLTRSGRIPLHAAGLIFGDTAVLLAGRSGSGKSTLSLAALRDGFSVLSDDTVYLQLEPRLRVWGFPRPIHLLVEAEEPASHVNRAVGGTLRRRGGRWKIAVTAEQEWPNGPTAERTVFCLLERGREVSLRPIDPTLAIDRAMASLEPGFDHFRNGLPAAIEALTAGGAWLLTLSADPMEAIAVLRRFTEGDTESRG